MGTEEKRIPSSTTRMEWRRMKVKLRLIAEIEAPNVMVARRKLDAFRESVLPSDNYGISLYEDYSEGKPGATVCEHFNEPFECPICKEKP
jgi:hypothetical protein